MRPLVTFRLEMPLKYVLSLVLHLSVTFSLSNALASTPDLRRFEEFTVVIVQEKAKLTSSVDTSRALYFLGKMS